VIRRWILARCGPWAGPLLVALVYLLLFLAFVLRISTPLAPFRYGHL
jgi:hypothetical protein